jgi:hypothetical protein
LYLFKITSILSLPSYLLLKQEASRLYENLGCSPNDDKMTSILKIALQNLQAINQSFYGHALACIFSIQTFTINTTNNNNRPTIEEDAQNIFTSTSVVKQEDTKKQSTLPPYFFSSRPPSQHQNKITMISGPNKGGYK